MNPDQYERVANGSGFWAALDQSGGSTPNALAQYGIEPGTYDPADMFDLMHEARVRMVTDPAFDGDKVIAAILFAGSLDREIYGLRTADYLWQVKRIVPFVKVDKGLEDLAEGVQLMKDVPGIMADVEKAKRFGAFGTKMRSLIKENNHYGIERVVNQQFDIAEPMIAQGQVPMLEPEVDINANGKEEIESELRWRMRGRLASVSGPVILKLTLPEIPGFYHDLTRDPKVLRVVALSGGYSQAEACRMLAENHGVSASFSRALAEGLRFDQSPEEFSAILGASVRAIYEASLT